VLRELARDPGVFGAVVEQPLDDAGPIVHAIGLAQELRAELELLRGLAVLAELREQLGELHARRDVVLVDLHHLAHDADELLVVARAGEARGERLEVGERVRNEPELHVQVGELAVQVREVRVDREDLLVDRDRFEREALVVVALGDARVRRDGLFARAPSDLQIADLQQDPHVVGVLLHEALVLRDGLVELAFRGELLRAVEDLLTVDAHGGPMAGMECEKNATRPVIDASSERRFDAR
jgi:hypothetical protein